MELVSQQQCKSEGTKHILLVIVYALMYCFGKKREKCINFKLIDNETFSVSRKF
jgi:hypothetical protein